MDSSGINSNGGGQENFTALQLDILNAVQGGTHDDTGCHINEVVTRLQGRFSTADIQHQMNFLTEEGHLFTTIDELHIKRTVHS